MNIKYLFSEDEIKKTYEQTGDHVHTKYLITKYSTNPYDVRDIALQGLDLSGAEHILELGCGYGSFTKNLTGLLGRDAEITGIDMVPENGKPFLSAVKSMNYKGYFICGRADCIKEFEDNLYDVIIASYSLYFFPHLIEDVARILKPEGVFIAITHSQYSLQEVLHLIPESMKNIGLTPIEKTTIARLFEAFSLENGREQLAPHFGRIDEIVYENVLRFSPDEIQDCIDYLEKKQYLLFKDVAERHPLRIEHVKNGFYKCLHNHAKEKGEILLTKDDVIFHCFNPGNPKGNAGSST
jgi:ubiquinone/menaquinone biosynthesis C-methylase UbiE